MKIVRGGWKLTKKKASKWTLTFPNIPTIRWKVTFNPPSPLKTWWLFLRSVWRPPHSFFRSCRVSCSNSPATSLTVRLPEEEGGRRRRRGWKMRAKNRETKEQEEVCRCYIHQYINTLLQACTEIIFSHHYRVRKKHPIQLIGLETMSAVVFLREAEPRLRCDIVSVKMWKCSRSKRVDQCYIQNILQGERG